MMKYVSAALVAVALIGGGLAWMAVREDAAVERGVDQQVARDVAKANQEIGEMRVRDAKFDKMDARQFCIDAGLEWVFEDSRSFCR